MGPVRDLSQFAARLLLVFLLHSGAMSWTMERLMAEAGISKRATAYKARLELARLGYIELNSKPGLRTTVTLLFNPTSASFQSADVAVLETDPIPPPPDIYSLYIYGEQPSNGSGSQVEVVPETVPSTEIGTTQNGYYLDETNAQAGVELVPVLGTTSNGYYLHEVLPDLGTTENGDHQEVLTLLERCEAVDAMDASGDLMQAKSHAQQRRKAQMVLVREVWTTHFPQAKYPLTDRRCKDFLSQCANSTAVFLGVVEDVARYIDHAQKHFDDGYGLQRYVEQAIIKQTQKRLIESALPEPRLSVEDEYDRQCQLEYEQRKIGLAARAAKKWHSEDE